MSRWWRLALAMLLLLLTISLGTEKTNAYDRCNVPVAARYDYFSNMRLYACLSVTTPSNLQAYSLSCQWTAIGINITNVQPYQYTTYVNGVRSKVLGCRYNKGVFWLPGGTTCWVEATVWPYWYGGSVGWGYKIGSSRSNWC